MAALSKFYQFVAPFVPGAPEFAMALEVRTAAIEFCQRSLAHQRTLDSVASVAGQSLYDLVFLGDVLTLSDDASIDLSDVVTLSPDAVSPGNVEVVAKLLSVKVDGEPLRLLAPQQMDEFKAETTAQAPTCALLAGPMRLQVYPTPSVAGKAIVVRAAMRPAQEAATIDDELFERFARVIADGAIARLAALPGKAFSNPDVAMAAQLRFDDAIAKAHERAFLNDTRAVQRSRRISWC